MFTVCCECQYPPASTMVELFTCTLQVLEGIAIPVDLSDREALLKAATT